MKSHRILTVVSMLFIASTLAAADMSWYEAVDDCIFTGKSAAGDSKYGFTYYPVRNNDKNAAHMASWCKPIEQGTTEIWYDSNGNGTRDSEDKSESLPYYAWYSVSMDGGVDNPDAREADGSVPYAKEKVQARITSWSLKPGSIGDLSGVGDGTISFARGPFACNATISLNIQVGDNGMGGDTTPLRMSDRYDKSAYLNSKADEWRQKKTDTAVSLATQVLARWEEYYSYALAQFRPDVGPYWLRQNEVPSGLAISGDVPADGKRTNGATMHYYRWKDGSKSNFIEHYGVQITIFDPSVGTKWSEIMASVNSRFAQEGEPMKPHAKQVNLPGADACVQGLWRNTSNQERVVIRKKNALVVVWAEVNAPKLAPTRAMELAKKVLAKMNGGTAPPSSDGEVVVTLSANPQLIWADGKTACKLELVAMKGGVPLSGADFSIEMSSNLLGECKQVKFITDGTGKDIAEYVPSKVGENTITAKGAIGKAEVTISQGGIVLSQSDGNQTSVSADGKSGTTLTAKCVHPQGKPISGVSVGVKLEGDGKVMPLSAVTNADGTAHFTYTPPAIDATTGVRAQDTYVTATAKVGNPARSVADNLRLTLYAGEVLLVAVEKPGYEPVRSVMMQVQQKGGTAQGTVVTNGWSKEEFPVAFAEVLLTTTGGKPLGKGQTDNAGQFSIKYQLDMSASTDAVSQMTKPVNLGMSPDLLNRFAECKADLEILKSKKYDMSTAESFVGDYPYNLAKSAPLSVGSASAGQSSDSAKPDQPEQKKKSKGLLGTLEKLGDELGKLSDKLSGNGKDDQAKNGAAGTYSTEYLINNGPRLAWMCRYSKLLAERQAESVDWMLGSMETAIEDVNTAIGINDKLEAAAKGKLADQFEADYWKKLKQKTAYVLLSQVADVVNRAVDTAKSMNYDSKDVKSLNVSKDIMNLATKPEKVGVEWGTDGAKDALISGLRSLFESAIHNDTQAALNYACGRIYRGEASAADYSQDAGAAKEIFTTFEKEHNQLNAANLDRELYRLWAKGFADTFIKGPYLYLNIKNLAADKSLWTKIASLDPKALTDIQEQIKDSGEFVDRAFAALDTMFQGYQGYQWIVDAMKASTVRNKIGETIIR